MREKVLEIEVDIEKCEILWVPLGLIVGMVGLHHHIHMREQERERERDVQYVLNPSYYFYFYYYFFYGKTHPIDPINTSATPHHKHVRFANSFFDKPSVASLPTLPIRCTKASIKNLPMVTEYM